MEITSEVQTVACRGLARPKRAHGDKDRALHTGTCSANGPHCFIKELLIRFEVPEHLS